MRSLKARVLAALLLVPFGAHATDDALTTTQVFELYGRVIVHGDAASQSALASYLGTGNGPAVANALASLSHLDAAPELADWPRAAAALRTRQAAVRCTIDHVRYRPGSLARYADVDYRCRLPDLVALLLVYRQHPVPFNGPHPPQMAPDLAAAYTQMLAAAPAQDRIATLTFNRERQGATWQVGNPSPLMATLADAFLPFFEWNEHLQEDAE